MACSMWSSDPVGKIEGTIMMRLLIALILSLCLAACAGTTVRMAKRYGHISADAQRAAVSVLQSPAAQKESSDIPADGNRPPTHQ